MSASRVVPMVTSPPDRGWTARLATTTLLTAGIAGLSGCSEAPKSNLVPVEGRVTLDGKPLTSGSVSLRPESKGTWDQPTGPIAGEDGHYTIYTNGQRGAPPGAYRVVIFATESGKTSSGAAHPGMPKSVIPKRYNDPQSTPLRVQVGASSGPAAFDLELVSRP